MSPSHNKEAPIFTAAWDLNLWVQRKLGGQSHVLADAVARESLAVLDAVVLALKGFERLDQVHLADRHLVRLRMRICLAWETELMEERQARYLLELTDDIGRQLGGWQKRLTRA